MAVKMLLFLLPLSFLVLSSVTEAARPHYPGAPISGVKGPRDIKQCTCHKSCNPKNDICFDTSVCWACHTNGTIESSSPAPAAADSEAFVRFTHASRCTCRKICNPVHEECYDSDACLSCQNALAPEAANGNYPKHKCTCHKSCNPSNDLCYDEAACLSCQEGNALAPQSASGSSSTRCSCRKSCNLHNINCYDEVVCLGCQLGLFSWDD